MTIWLSCLSLFIYLFLKFLILFICFGLLAAKESEGDNMVIKTWFSFYSLRFLGAQTEGQISVSMLYKLRIVAGSFEF